MDDKKYDMNNTEAELYIKMAKLMANKVDDIPSKTEKIPSFISYQDILIDKEIANKIIFNTDNYQKLFIYDYNEFKKKTNINKDKKDIYSNILFYIGESISKSKSYEDIDNLYNSTKFLVARSININKINKLDYIKTLQVNYMVIREKGPYSLAFQLNIIPEFIIKLFITNKDERNKLLNNETSLFDNEYFDKEMIIDSYFSNLMILENECTKISEIDELYDNNIALIESFIKEYGFSIFPSLLSFLACTSLDLIEVGLDFDYLNNITNNNFKNKVDYIINNKKDMILINDYDEYFFTDYLCNLAYNQDFNKDIYYEHLFDMCSQKIYKDDILDTLYKQILLNYGKEQIKKFNLKNTYIFCDKEVNEYNGNIIDGCCSNFLLDGVDNRLINIRDILIDEWDYYLSVVMHEIKHATQYGYSKDVCLRQFRIELERFLLKLCENDYHENFKKLFYEVEAHLYGFNYAKETISNNTIVDLDQIDFYDKEMQQYIENDKINTRKYNGKDKNIFTLYKKILRLYTLYHILHKEKKSFLYENKLPKSLQLITNPNLKMKSYKEIESLLNSTLDEDEKEIYSYVLNNWQNSKVRKKSK